MPDAAHVPAAFRDALATWWKLVGQKRDELPWRSTRDPWRVLVAETMLAQTQASRVAERYEAMVSAIPTPAAAAAIPLGELLELWSGLGYYRRAVSLRLAAQRIVDRHGGAVPSSLPELLELPGVGAYTARAVLVFGFGLQAAVLDTNIGRVLARAVAGRTLGRSEAQRLADDLIDGEAPRAWNLALMDLGATVCTAREPHCERCPLQAGHCSWRSAGQLADPAVRSAATSRPQRRFEGSDRQGRGRILRAALDGPIASADLAAVAGWPDDPVRTRTVVRQMVAESILHELADGSIGVASSEVDFAIAAPAP